MNRNALVLILVVIVALAVVTGSGHYPPHTSPQDSFRLEFSKTGGMAGVNDILTIRGDGSATLVSRYGVSFNATVPIVEFSELKQVVAKNLDNISPRTFQAKAGTADYFGYQLAVTTDAGRTELLWVDQWAVNGTLPDGLSALQGEVQNLETDLAIRHSLGNTNTSEAGALRLTVLIDKTSYKIGEQVSFGVILENTGSSNITYTSPTPCTQDTKMVVSSGSTTQEITTNDGPPCIQVLQARTLQGNTYLVQTGVWDMTLNRGGIPASAPPGSYTIMAVFPYASSEKTLVSSSVEISVAG